MTVFRNEIYIAELDPTQGQEQGGARPVVIVQNNVGNRFSNTTQVAPITKSIHKTKPLPTHVNVSASGLYDNSTIMAEQMRTIDKSRLRQKLGGIDPETDFRLKKAILTSLGMPELIPTLYDMYHVKL